MDSYLLALFIHLLVVVLAFCAITLIHFHLWHLSRTEQVAEARQSIGGITPLVRTMPLIALALFLTGAYMTQVRWTWRTPWVGLAIGGLAAILVIGLGLLRPRLLRAGRALAQAGDPRLGPETQVFTRDRVLWIGASVQPLLVAGVMFVMVFKPGVAVGVIGLLVAMAIGVSVGVASAPPAPASGKAPVLAS